VPDGERVTLAALRGERRRACSHHERAVQLLRDWLPG
jgi:inosine/xanthosine triphosphate pyrophosphatase family protein